MVVSLLGRIRNSTIVIKLYRRPRDRQSSPIAGEYCLDIGAIKTLIPSLLGESKPIHAMFGLDLVGVRFRWRPRPEPRPARFE